MKKFIKIMSVFICISTFLSSVAYALDTMEFDGYKGSTGGPQLSISNIIGTDEYLSSKTEQYDVENGAYTCQAPVTVTTLADDLMMFDVTQIAPSFGELFYASYKVEPVGTVSHYSLGTVSYSSDMEFGDYTFKKGTTATITKPGMYHIIARFDAMAGATSIFLNVIDEVSPTTSKIYVDGKEVQFEAYNIDDNNYFKLRDIAKAISQSPKQFDVLWSQEKSAINLVSNKAYTEVGGELVLGDGSKKKASQMTSDIYIDDIAMGFTAYTINDNNYFQLRDIGFCFNFDVSWDAKTNSILIETNKDYTDD